MTTAYRIDLPDPSATTRLAALLAGVLSPGLCVWLCGELGSGKTHMARGMLRALGWQGPVRSPTYTLLETYELAPAAGRQGAGVDSARAALASTPKKVEAESGFTLYHFDLYRMASSEEWVEAGFDDLLDSAVRLIEWPERGACFTPAADLKLVLAAQGHGRIVTVTVCSRAGEDTWQRLESGLQGQRGASALRWAPAV